jgi:hypothetical protein
LYALEHLTDEDLAFPGHYQIVPIELARAQAGLGDYQSAETRLRELIEEHTPWQNPLSLGSLHEALAELAAARGDQATFLASLREMERWFRATRHPALVARCERLIKQLVARTLALSERPEDSPQLLTMLHGLRQGRDAGSASGAAWTLQQLSGLRVVQEAYLFAQDDHGQVQCVANVCGEQDVNELTPWVHGQLAGLREEMVTRTVGLDGEQGAPDVFSSGGRSYRLIVLRAGADDEKVAGALVVPRDADLPQLLIGELAAQMGAEGSRPGA